MRTLIALFVGVLLVGALTSGACNNCGCKDKCGCAQKACGCKDQCSCKKSCGGCNDCTKCKANCCVTPKNICSFAELMDYNCPCVPVCCLCVRIDFCGCDDAPMTVTFLSKSGKELGTFNVDSCEECYTFEESFMANDLGDVIFTPTGDKGASVTGVKIWSKLGNGDKVTLANFDMFQPSIVGGENGCSQLVIF